MSKELIKEFISDFPIYQYAFLEPEEIEYQPKVRQVCKRTCKYYSNSWSCPPAVGKIEVLKEKCLKYTDVLLFSTFTEITDEKFDKVSIQKEHEKLTRIISNRMKDLGYLTYIISSGSCKICDKCTFPKDFCRHPYEMFPCIESHGITVADLLSDCGMDYYMGDKFQLLFSLVFFKDTGFDLTENKEED